MANLLKVEKASGCFSIKMMKKYFLIYFLVGLITSCSKKEVVIPENVLKQKEMSSVLADIHVAQAVFNNKSYNDSTTYTVNDYLDYILKQNGVGKDTFMQSMKFYSEHPEMLLEVYDSVLTSLSRLQGEVESVQ
jgi:hypothetical protein